MLLKNNFLSGILQIFLKKRYIKKQILYSLKENGHELIFVICDAFRCCFSKQKLILIFKKMLTQNVSIYLHVLSRFKSVFKFIILRSMVIT